MPSGPACARKGVGEREREAGLGQGAREPAANGECPVARVRVCTGKNPRARIKGGRVGQYQGSMLYGAEIAIDEEKKAEGEGGGSSVNGWCYLTELCGAIRSLVRESGTGTAGSVLPAQDTRSGLDMGSGHSAQQFPPPFVGIIGGNREADLDTGKVVAQVRPRDLRTDDDFKRAVILLVTRWIYSPSVGQRESVLHDVWRQQRDGNAHVCWVSGGGTIGDEVLYGYLYGVRFDMRSGNVDLIRCTQDLWSEYESSSAQRGLGPPRQRSSRSLFGGLARARSSSAPHSY